MGVARSRLQAPGPGTNQPRSQSSSAISDVTSPVSLSGKFALDYRARFQASSCNWDGVNWPGYEPGYEQLSGNYAEIFT